MSHSVVDVSPELFSGVLSDGDGKQLQSVKEEGGGFWTIQRIIEELLAQVLPAKWHLCRWYSMNTMKE